MQIIPIRDLRDTTRISELCHKTEEPIYVTKNGYGDMVVMSMSAYENMFARMQVHDAVILASNRAKSGALTDGTAEFARLDKKYE